MGDVYEECVGGSLKLKGGKVKKRKKKSSKAKEVLETVERVEEEEERAAGGTDTRTEAQKSFDKVLDKRQKERILKKAKKTHKQRVEELNSYMDSLSEHYDIPKVSWTK